VAVGAVHLTLAGLDRGRHLEVLHQEVLRRCLADLEAIVSLVRSIVQVGIYDRKGW
jgi:hypothetical protein